MVRSRTPAAEAVRNLLTAGAVMAAGVLVCIVRAPKPLETTDGLSWFGFIAFTSLVDLDDAMLYGQLLFQVAFTGCLAVGVATRGGRGQRVLGSGRRPTSARST